MNDYDDIDWLRDNMMEPHMWLAAVLVAGLTIWALVIWFMWG